MKRTIIFFIIASIMMAWIIGCQAGPGAEEVFNEAKKLQEDADYAAAVMKYEQLVAKHSKSSFAPQAQFMIGFIYANELDELDKAKVAYEVFLENYASKSDSGMVASARWELDNLGKDIDEIEDLSIISKDTEEKTSEESGE